MLQSAVATRTRPTVNRSTVKAAAKKPTQSLDQQYEAAQAKAEELKTQLDSARAEFFTETSKPLAARARGAGEG